MHALEGPAQSERLPISIQLVSRGISWALMMSYLMVSRDRPEWRQCAVWEWGRVLCNVDRCNRVLLPKEGGARQVFIWARRGSATCILDDERIIKASGGIKKIYRWIETRPCTRTPTWPVDVFAHLRPANGWSRITNTAHLLASSRSFWQLGIHCALFDPAPCPDIW
jgi:hypothetical protein